MIEINIAWRPFRREEMPKDSLEIIILINPSLESDNGLKLGTDHWTGTKTERFIENRIAYWAPSNETVIWENTEKIHDS